VATDVAASLRFNTVFIEKQETKEIEDSGEDPGKDLFNEE
jgi:hypothetical protein